MKLTESKRAFKRILNEDSNDNLINDVRDYFEVVDDVELVYFDTKHSDTGVLVAKLRLIGGFYLDLFKVDKFLKKYKLKKAALKLIQNENILILNFGKNNL